MRQQQLSIPSYLDDLSQLLPELKCFWGEEDWLAHGRAEWDLAPFLSPRCWLEKGHVAFFYFSPFLKGYMSARGTPYA